MYLINPSLDDKLPTSRGHQLFKDFFEVLCDLFECSIDSFVFSLIECLDQLLDAPRTPIKVFSPLEQGISLLREVAVLFESLFVHVRKLFETLINSMQLFH